MMADNSSIDWSKLPIHHLLKEAHQRIATKVSRQWSDEVLVSAGNDINDKVTQVQTEMMVDEQCRGYGLRAMQDIPEHTILGLFPIHYAVNETTGHMYDMINDDTYLKHEMVAFKDAMSTPEQQEAFLYQSAGNAVLQEHFRNFVASQKDLTADANDPASIPIMTQYRPDFIGVSLRKYATKAYCGHLAQQALDRAQVQAVIAKHYKPPMTMEIYHTMLDELIEIMSQTMNAIPIMFADVSPLMILVSIHPIAANQPIVAYCNIEQMLAASHPVIAKTIRHFQRNETPGYDRFDKHAEEHMQTVLKAFQQELVHIRQMTSK